MQSNTLINLKSFRALVVVIAIAPLLQGGCIVDSEPDPNTNTIIYPTNPTNLDFRELKPNDEYHYEFTGTYSLESGGIAENTSGTLIVKYSVATPLTHPFNNTVISVLNETSILEFNDGPQITSVRYILQDSDGTINTVAYPGAGTGNEYWVNAITDIEPTAIKSSIQMAPILKSPITQGDSYNNTVNVLTGCISTGVCDDWLRRITETVTVGSSEVIASTPLGNFSSIQINFNSSLSQDFTEKVINRTSTIFSLRTACEIYNLNSSDKVSATFSEVYFVFPEVGVVRFELNCIAIGYFIKGYLTEVININIPEATTP